MPITQEQLAARLRAAREACRLTQDEVAENLGVSRATIAQTELGKRPVSSLELDKLAYLYGRDIREFLSDEFRERDAFAALFRGDPDLAKDEATREVLRRCMELGRQLTKLETVVGVGRGWTAAPAYPSVAPGSKWDAVQQGERVASEERRRLGLGWAPIGDLPELLEAQGVRALARDLPSNISGLTLSEPGVGLLVAANRKHHPHRVRFSYAHEDAHVLLDRERLGLISRVEDRNDLIEVRANAFAAAFLMPEDGVREFVGAMGKGRASRLRTTLYDEDAPTSAESRTEPGSQDMQVYDVLHVAHHFWVSPEAALYRLKNLKMVTEAEFSSLQPQVKGKQAAALGRLLDLPAQEPDRDEFRHRFLTLALEAYRREAITRAKLDELGALVDLSAEEVAELVESSGLPSGRQGDVLLPRE